MAAVAVTVIAGCVAALAVVLMVFVVAFIWIIAAPPSASAIDDEYLD